MASLKQKSCWCLWLNEGQIASIYLFTVLSLTSSSSSSLSPDPIFSIDDLVSELLWHIPRYFHSAVGRRGRIIISPARIAKFLQLDQLHILLSQASYPILSQSSKLLIAARALVANWIEVVIPATMTGELFKKVQEAWTLSHVDDMFEGFVASIWEQASEAAVPTQPMCLPQEVEDVIIPGLHRMRTNYTLDYTVYTETREPSLYPLVVYQSEGSGRLQDIIYWLNFHPTLYPFFYNLITFITIY